MKKTLTLFLLVIFQVSFGQDLTDTIFTKAGETIICKITLVNDNWIYYDHKVKKGIDNDYIHKEDVKKYFEKGEISIPYKSKPKELTEVVNVDSVSKDQLFSSFMDWVAKNYVSAQSVVQYQDKAEGKIIVKGCIPVYLNSINGSESAGCVYHTLSIYVKENRYKYSVENMYHESNGKYASGGSLTNEKGGLLTRGQWEKIKAQANTGIENTIQSLKKSATEIKSSNDW